MHLSYPVRADLGRRSPLGHERVLERIYAVLGPRTWAHRPASRAATSTPGHRSCRPVHVQRQNHPGAKIWIGGDTFMVNASASPTSATAVSRPGGPPSWARSGGRCNDVSVDLRRSPPAEHLAGPAIHLCGDEADLFEADVVEVGALRELLAQQPVHVLVGGTLPR